MGRFFILFSVTLFLIIGVAAWRKKGASPQEHATAVAGPIEIDLGGEVELVANEPKPVEPVAKPTEPEPPKAIEVPHAEPVALDDLPVADRIHEFFHTHDPKFPIVETVTYKSRVDWLKGRPAWLTDYAAHFKTSRHFIARSLNGKPDYFKQDLSEGDKFNILHPEKDVEFYLLIDLSRCKMWFYYLDHETHEQVLVKTYDVGLGRIDPTKPSGLLTPLGKYRLGEKIAVYKPTVMGMYNNEKVEMIRVFGTRWIPFESEVENTTASAKGFGIHGSPWLDDPAGSLITDESGVGKYESDGCIRLRTDDMEELFSVIISRPTTVEMVRDFHEAALPAA